MARHTAGYGACICRAAGAVIDKDEEAAQVTPMAGHYTHRHRAGDAAVLFRPDMVVGRPQSLHDQFHGPPAFDSARKKSESAAQA